MAVQREDIPHPLQLFCVVLVDDGRECGHTVPGSSVPSRLVLLGQLDPGQHGDGVVGGCGVVGDMFLKDVELAGVLLCVVVELNYFEDLWLLWWSVWW